ncbi:MAG: glycosyltransferase family 4 protein [Syntrophobacteraceae bacterium]
MNYLAVVDNFFLDSPSGSARVAWDIAKLARDQGWKVALLCLNTGSTNRPDGPSEHEGILVVRYSKPSSGGGRFGGYPKQIDAAADAFNQWLSATRWDTIHIHSPLAGAGVSKVCNKAARLVCTVHSPIVSELRINWANQGLQGKVKLIFGLPMVRFMERRLLAKSEEVHVLSEFTRREMQRFHGIGDRVRVIPHWCRDGFHRRLDKGMARRRLGWDENGIIFFTARGHRERYGLEDAIRAMAPLAEKHAWKFYICGDGPLRPGLEGLVSSLGLSGRILFTGRMTDESLILAYQAADLFLLPTKALECFGLIILEALACGCPIIATDAGAIPEIMLSILPGCLVPAGNITALSRKVQCFLESQLKLPSSSELAEFCETCYGKGAITSRMVELLGPSGSGQRVASVE